MTLKMLKFTQRLVSSETLQLSLFSPPPRYSVISNQIITLLPTIVMTSRIVVYMGAWFTGPCLHGGVVCVGAWFTGSCLHGDVAARLQLEASEAFI